jgi:hypothetical protein
VKKENASSLEDEAGGGPDPSPERFSVLRFGNSGDTEKDE